MAVKMAVCALFVTCHLFCLFGIKGQNSSHLPCIPWTPIISRPFYMRYNVSSRHKRYFKSLCHSHHMCLLILLSGDIELNPGPDDEVKCVCESSDEFGLMLQCDSCSCWSHSEYVGVSSRVANNYPFICPFCIKSIFSLVSSLRSDISHLKAHITKLESSYKTLNSLSSEFPIVQQSLATLSSKVNSISQPSSSANHVSNQQIPELATEMQSSPSISRPPPSSASISSQNDVSYSNQSAPNSLQSMTSSNNSTTITQLPPPSVSSLSSSLKVSHTNSTSSVHPSSLNANPFLSNRPRPPRKPPLLPTPKFPFPSYSPSLFPPAPQIPQTSHYPHLTHQPTTNNSHLPLPPPYLYPPPTTTFLPTSTVSPVSQYRPLFPPHQSITNNSHLPLPPPYLYPPPTTTLPPTSTIPPVSQYRPHFPPHQPLVHNLISLLSTLLMASLPLIPPNH